MQFSYKDQISLLSDLRLREGQEHRGDCPFCGGRNTFTVTKRDGALVWNCFKASCGVRGSKGGPVPPQSVQRLLDGLAAPTRAMNPVPTPLVAIDGRPDIINWLTQVNSLEAYQQKLINILYAPSEDRIMFEINKQGYTGRSLDAWPKWKKYGDSNHCIVVGSGSCGVVVEDAPSACAVGVCTDFSGIAILGTNLTRNIRQELNQFKELIICLDPDASLKAMEMVSQLSSRHSVTMIVPPDDLKYFNKEKIETILNGNTTT